MTEIYDVIVIGAGPAGVSSAIYLKRANKKVVVFEKNVVGGQVAITPDVKNYAGFNGESGFELASIMQKQLEENNIELRFEEVVKADLKGKEKIIYTHNGTFYAHAVILCLGAGSKKLNAVGEKKLAGKGVSYCATCDGNFFKNKDVVVIGGGNTALEDVLYLSNLCKKVILVHRRDEFRADPITVDTVKSLENVEICYSSTVSEFLGETFLEGIRLKDLKTNQEKDISVSGAFVSIGRAPDIDFLNGEVEVDNMGYIMCNQSLQTNIEGVFVAGDIRPKMLRQIVTAVSDGAEASVFALNYLRSSTNS